MAAKEPNITVKNLLSIFQIISYKRVELNQMQIRTFFLQ